MELDSEQVGSYTLSTADSSERRARVLLSFLAQPGDAVLGAALRTMPATEVLAMTTGSDADGEAMLTGRVLDPALARAIARWRDRLGEVPSSGQLAAWRDSGLRLIVPGIVSGAADPPKSGLRPRPGPWQVPG